MQFKQAGRACTGWVKAQCDGFSALDGSVKVGLHVHEEVVAPPTQMVLDAQD